MTGPTREEVEAACNEFSRMYPDLATTWTDEMWRVLNAAEPLMRARHVREAVEGLGYSGLVSLACDLNEAGLMKAGQPDLVSGETASEAFVRRSRAALLAALTGEGM